MRGRTSRIRELLYVLSHSSIVCATEAALYIVNRQIVTTMLHKRVQSGARGEPAVDIELLGRAGTHSGPSRSGNPVSWSANVRTDDAASFLSFSFFSFLHTSRPAAGCCAEFAYARTARHAMEFTRRDTNRTEGIAGERFALYSVSLPTCVCMCRVTHAAVNSTR